jgi:VWFA-related protein
MHRTFRTLVRPRPLAILFALLLLTLAVSAQQAEPPQPVQPDRQMPPVTFRVEVNYVEVDAVVVDKEGRFVSDLQASDFQVFEDRTPQAVTNFGLVQIPIEKPEAPLFVRQPIEPDTQTNAKPFDGRVYVIVLDELHTQPQHTLWVRSAAKKFIQATLGANDLAAVVSIQGRASQEFTGNKRLLQAAVDRFVGNAITAATLNDAVVRSYHATNTLKTLQSLSDFMAGVHGRRKAVVLFSEGIDYDIRDVANDRNAFDVLAATRDAIGAATRANVTLYTVDPRGLYVAGAEASVGLVPAGVDLAWNFRLEQDSLRVLAEETGGFAALDSNDFTSAFGRIQQDNSNYYVLGYYPSNDRRDGNMRQIDVKVNRPGVEVRFRKGYLAPRGKVPAAGKRVEAQAGTPAELEDALGSPVPVAGLRLAVTAAPFRGKAPNAAVTLVVQADGRDFAFQQKDGKYDDALSLAVIALDPQSGKTKGGLHHSLTMPLQPATYQQVVRYGLRVTTRMEVPPGRYQLRVAAAEANGKRLGAVHYDLEVPDFDTDPLTMSGVVLTSSLAGQTPTIPGNPDDDMRKALPGPPTVTREFRSGEELALLSEIYDNETKSPHRVDIATTLRSDDGREVFRHEDGRASSELGGGRAGYGHTARVPLKGLSPGLYVLKVEARSRLGKGFTVFREVQIRVTQ